MNKKPVFLRCSHCGNIVGTIEFSGVPVMCCGEAMKELIPNTVEAATEKHIPVVKRFGDTITVSVGEIEHPMLEEHYIQWIALIGEKSTFRIRLEPGDKPVVTFKVDDGAYDVYEYCNLHGLWITKI